MPAEEEARRLRCALSMCIKLRDEQRKRIATIKAKLRALARRKTNRPYARKNDSACPQTES